MIVLQHEPQSDNKYVCVVTVMSIFYYFANNLNATNKNLNEIGKKKKSSHILMCVCVVCVYDKPVGKISVTNSKLPTVSSVHSHHLKSFRINFMLMFAVMEIFAFSLPLTMAPRENWSGLNGTKNKMSN